MLRGHGSTRTSGAGRLRGRGRRSRLAISRGGAAKRYAYQRPERRRRRLRPRARRGSCYWPWPTVTVAMAGRRSRRCTRGSRRRPPGPGPSGFARRALGARRREDRRPHPRRDPCPRRERRKPRHAHDAPASPSRAPPRTWWCLGLGGRQPRLPQPRRRRRRSSAAPIEGKLLFLGAPMRESDELGLRIGHEPLTGVRGLALSRATGLSERGIGVADPAASRPGRALQPAADTHPAELRPARDRPGAGGNHALASHRSHDAGDNIACAVWLRP